MEEERLIACEASNEELTAKLAQSEAEKIAVQRSGEQNVIEARRVLGLSMKEVEGEALRLRHENQNLVAKQEKLELEMQKWTGR